LAISLIVVLTPADQTTQSSQAQHEGEVFPVWHELKSNTQSACNEWAGSDAEFTTALERLNAVQENDPFKTGTEEDTFVTAMMIALVVMETRERHFNSQNL
jgi:hypothetical protein